MIDVQEVTTQTGGPLTQSIPTTKTDKAGVRATTSQPRYSLLGVLKSGRIKLWSLHAVQVMVVLMLVPMAIISLLVLLFADVSGGTQLLAVDAAARVFIIIDLIFTVVLGNTFATGEFSTGPIRPSLGAIPNRGLLVVTRIMMLALFVLILSIFAVSISVVPGLIILSMRGVEQSLKSPIIRMIIGLYLCSVLMGLFLFCIGFFGRSSVGAISVTLGILWILPPVVRMLGGGRMAQAIMARLPGVAGSQVFVLESASSTGGIWGGLTILAASVVVMSVIAVGQFKGPDV